VRRFADFYVKSAYQYTAPYVMPIDLYPEELADKVASLNTGKTKTLLGEIDGKKYYCPPVGHRLTSNTTLLAASLAVQAFMRAAVVLGDPVVENCARRLFGFTYLGENAFNWMRVTGFGDDPCQAVWSYYRFVPGMVTCYPNLYFLDRTLPLAHINEIWTNTQAQAVMGCLALDAPCRVRGRITSSGKPLVGPARIVTHSGRETPAVAGAKVWVEFDTEREITLAVHSLSTEGAPTPRKCGFLHLKASVPTIVRLLASPQRSYLHFWYRSTTVPLRTRGIFIGCEIASGVSSYT